MIETAPLGSQWRSDRRNLRFKVDDNGGEERWTRSFEEESGGDVW